MLILLVEDDVKIASFIVKGLKSAGYAVDHASDGEEGLHLALSRPYDAAVIDIMLPQRDGLSLITNMRAKKVNTPVIILSAKGSVDDRVKGLQAGGDDYLPKPFAFSELLARVQALIRRASGASAPRRRACPRPSCPAPRSTRASARRPVAGWSRCATRVGSPAKR